MPRSFDTVTIVGVGLLGASLGLALKQRNLARTIRGVGHRQETLDKAKALGAIDEATTDVLQASIGADLIVLCTPAAVVPDHLDIIRTVCGKDTVVTDVASTKGQICGHVRERWHNPYRFIGSHPMAGSEKFGPEHASADLYQDTVCFVEKRDEHAEDAHQTVIDLWQSLGADTVEIDPGAHDAIVARTSHAPHIVASALSQLTANLSDIGPFIGKGFRDATRIAEGRPEIWRDICLTNSAAIEESLGDMLELLGSVRESVASGDEDALQQFFERGREAKQRVTDE